MTPVAALSISALRRIPIMFWVMDINPDQAIAMGEVSSNSTAARLLDWANRRLLNRAAAVITLDRFMANSLEQKARMGARLRVLPPWPHQQYVQGINHSNNPFRSAHNLDERFVVLYSGNHSPAHPLETLIEAARMLEGRPNMAFLFVGGGLGKEPVEAAIRNDRLVDTISLPYQPLAQIRYSLSAGDVHVVSMGDQMVGCVHPSKVYAAMAVGRPIVLLGPPDCHVGDLIREHGIGWQIDHGDVKGLVSLLLRLGDHPEEVAAAGLRAKAAVDGAFSRKRLMTAFTDLVAGAFD
jgi:glycosyltransferase involved in cell wall biosynthesis